MQLRPQRRNHGAEKDRTLTQHNIASVGRIPDVAKECSLTELCSVRVTCHTRSVTVALHLENSMMGRPPIREVFQLKAAAFVLQLRRNTHYNVSWLQQVEGSKGNRCKESETGAGRTNGITTRLAAHKATAPKLFPGQQRLGCTWNHVVQGAA